MTETINSELAACISANLDKASQPGLLNVRMGKEEIAAYLEDIDHIFKAVQKGSEQIAMALKRHDDISLVRTLGKIGFGKRTVSGMSTGDTFLFVYLADFLTGDQFFKASHPFFGICLAKADSVVGVKSKQAYLKAVPLVEFKANPGPVQMNPSNILGMQSPLRTRYAHERKNIHFVYRRQITA